MAVLGEIITKNIVTQRLVQRDGQGKPAYSHVVTVTGPGKTIYIAGQLARDAEGNIVGPGDMRGSSCWSDWLPRSSAYARRSTGRMLGNP